jgi:hypothetical protein
MGWREGYVAKNEDEDGFSRMSEQELVAELSRLAIEVGLKITLSLEGQRDVGQPSFAPTAGRVDNRSTPPVAHRSASVVRCLFSQPSILRHAAAIASSRDPLKRTSVGLALRG